MNGKTSPFLEERYDSAQSWHLKSGTEESRFNYLNSRSRFRRALGLARASFYSNTFHKLRGDSAGFWRFIKQSCGRSTGRVELPSSLTTDAGRLDQRQDIADELNLHFASIGKDDTDIPPYLSTDVKSDIAAQWSSGDNKVKFFPFAESEILKALSSAKAGWRVGALGVPDRILRDNAQEITKPLTHILNQSIESGTFPDRLKNSFVVPLFKNKGARDNVVNYRPISLVDFISKVFERMIVARLDDHLAPLNFFSPSQYGFRKARSTELALGKLWQEIADTIEGDGVCLGVFLDLSAAFNRLDHEIFLHMLECLGFEDAVISWFRSYLSDRRQAVSAGQTVSSWRTIDIGTPQGSILGPYMFIVYMNFVLLSIKKEIPCVTIAYADDTSLLFRLSPASLQVDAEAAIGHAERVVDLFQKFGLAVNGGKTSFTLFHSARRSTEISGLDFMGSPVGLSNASRCLGLMLDEHLSWKPHLREILPKCYSIISSLRRLRENNIPLEGLTAVYDTLFLPVLTYGIVIWGGTYRSTIRRAQIIQNDALRAIHDIRRRQSVDDLYDKLGLLRISQIYSLRVAQLAFKVTNGSIPSDISFSVVPRPKLSDRRQTRFEMPLAVKESSRQSLAYRLPAVWNSLPRDIRSITSAKRFSKAAKNYLMYNNDS